MKKLLIIIPLILLTGCVSYTEEDLAQCKAMIQGEQEKDLRLDANHDGEITPADYVEISNFLESEKK